MAKLKSQVGDNRPWKDHQKNKGCSMRAVETMSAASLIRDGMEKMGLQLETA
jgi:hypothetical protein